MKMKMKTVENNLEKTILSIYSAIQNQAEYEDCADNADNHIPCPRCGHTRMNAKVTRNALSRHAEIQICDICGTDEAIRTLSGCVLPLSAWWILKKTVVAEKLETESQPVQTDEPLQASDPVPKRTAKTKATGKSKRASKARSNTKG
jgi:transcription elongation factor Elf1